LAGVVADVLGNQLLVRVFATEKTESRGIMRRRAAIENLALKEIEVIEREARDRQIVVYVFQIITLGGFIWLYSRSMLSVAGLIFAYTYLSRTTDAIFGIAGLIRSFEQTLLDAAPMTKILAKTATVLDTPKAKPLVVSRGAVTITQADFTYGDATDTVFEGLSVSVRPGERVGLAGPSGGGKSTLTKLLLRFADLDGGKILVDDQDISQVTQASLRSQIAYVPQEPFLFHRSLRDNIAYGVPGASDKQILGAAHRAHALEFIEKLPHGLDTIVGERGVKLSGGQRQRIAIARAILKDAPILILDEATSALDSESEQLIQASLDELMEGRTSIVIAHRLSTIAKLDRIIVLDEGKIVEEGTHEALLKQKGLYAKLWKHQSGGFIEE
jgi:ATP-binding cassette subfamily B protein